MMFANANNNNIGGDALLQKHHHGHLQNDVIEEDEIDHRNSLESSPLLASTPPTTATTTPYASSFSIFNDLTYSDDDDSDDSAYEGSPMDAESSKAFLDEIQNSILASSGLSGSHVNYHAGQPPMHPLARMDSETNDEGSYLAYSISSFPGEEEGGSGHPYPQSHGGQSHLPLHHNHHHIPLSSTRSYGSIGSANSATAVIFRQTSPVFGQSVLSKPSSSFSHSHEQQYVQTKVQETRQSSEPLREVEHHSQKQLPKRREEKENASKSESFTASSPKPSASSNYNYDDYSHRHNHHYQVFSTKHAYPATPTPSLASDSPATSATATDTTVSPTSPSVISPNGNDHTQDNNDVIAQRSPTASEFTHTSASASSSLRNAKSNKKIDNSSNREKDRVAKLLSEEAAKKLRRHKRLRKIKKAAEAREAAVQKVRGVDQFPSLDGDDDDEVHGNSCRADSGDGATNDNNSTNKTSDEETGCLHSKQCQNTKRKWDQSNDVVFAIIFLLQLALVSVAAIAFGPGALRDKIYDKFHGKSPNEEIIEDHNPFAGLQSDDVIITSMYRPNNFVTENDTDAEEDDWGISHIDYINVIQLVCIASGYASVCSLLALGFMMMLSKSLLHATLLLTIVVSLAWTCLGMAFSSYAFIPTLGLMALCLSFFYTMVVWERIPFAATNLSVALKGMRSTMDIPMMGVMILGVSFLWTIWWICGFIGVFDFVNDDEDLSNNWMGVVIVFFLFSYYWTIQVIKGISQATVAAIVGKWWRIPEDSLPICSGALRLSLYRNLTTSFGSICLGGLVVGPCMLMCRISTLLQLAQPKAIPRKKNATTTELPSGCKCCGISGGAESMTCSSYSDNIISRNVNQWSYTHIGLYGYKFWESGSKASQLFEARGWTRVVSDDLILTAIFMSSMVIGGSTACLGLIVEEVDGYSFTSLHKPITTAFLIGLFTGFYLSSAFLSIIEGSVSAILVNYATSPVEFHANHHVLSEEMKSVWKEFWLS